MTNFRTMLLATVVAGASLVVPVREQISIVQPGTPNSVTMQTVVETAAPAAGAESITTVPAGKYWRVSTFLATLTADATVATRTPSIVIDDGTNTVFRVYSSTGITASQSVAFPASPLGFTAVGVTGAALNSVPLPEPTSLVLGPGWRIRTLTTNIVAGDQWSIARLVVQETMR